MPMTQKNKVPCENRANNSWLKIVIFESNLNNAWFLLKQMMIIWHKLSAHVCVKYYEIWLIVNHLEKTSKVFLFYTQNLAKSLFLFIPILENSLWYALFLYFYESSHCSTVTNSEYKHGLCYRCLKPRAIWKIYILLSLHKTIINNIHMWLCTCVGYLYIEVSVNTEKN